MSATVDKATVRQLHELYERREKMEQAKTYASGNHYIEKFCETFSSGSGSNSSLVSALGGQKALKNLIERSIREELDYLQTALDAQIEKLGGKP